MKKNQELSVRMFGSVVSYIDAHPELVADTPQGRAIGARVAALRATIVAVRGAAASQHTATSQSRVEHGKEPELKRQLREVRLRSIAMVARGLSGTVPGIGLLRMPPANLRNAALIARATSFAEQARIYQSVLAEHGLADDAVDKLDAAIAAFSDSITGRRAARTSLVAATHAVREHIVTGRNIVTALDGVIRSVFDGRNDALASWGSARRVGRVQRGPVSLDDAPLPTALLVTTSVAPTGSTVAHPASSLAQAGARAGEACAPAVPSGATEVQQAA